MTQRGEAQVIASTVPLAEMFGIDSPLDVAGSRGVSMEFAHYEEAEEKAEEIVAKVSK